MTKAELKKIIDKHTTCSSDYEAIWRAVEAYSSASNDGKPIVSGSLPLVEQHLLDEAVSDVILISKMNEPKIAKKLISSQYYVAAKEDLFGGNDH